MIFTLPTPTSSEAASLETIFLVVLMLEFFFAPALLVTFRLLLLLLLLQFTDDDAATMTVDVVIEDVPPETLPLLPLSICMRFDLYRRF